MPESPQQAGDLSLLNGASRSTLSLGYGTVQRDFQQKFLEANGGALAGENDRTQLDRLLKNSNINPAKKFIRGANWGPNHVVRAQLWTRLARRLTTDADWNETVKHYRNTLPEIYRNFEGGSRAIPLPVFVDTSLTNTYHLNEEGCYRCQKVLTMVEANQPQITYAPVLHPLTALFLHFIEDDAEVFACIDALLRPRRVARKFMGDTVHAYKSAAHTMSELVRRRMKGIYNFILASVGGEKPDEFFDNWLKWIFVDLPFEVVIRVMDCYLYEGMKVLFRTGLALIKLFYRTSGQPNSVPNLSHSLSRFCQEFLKHSSSTELLKVGFSFSRLSQDQILKMIQDYEQVIKDNPSLMKSFGNSYGKAGGDAHRRSLSVPLPFVPEDVMKRSRILSEDQFYTLWQWLPMRHRIAQPTLLYTSEEHGVSLVTFFQQCAASEPTLLVVKTRTNEMFGAFCSHSWENRMLGGKSLSYFGTGESFLFTLLPEQRVYQWIGLGKENAPTAGSSMFMAADSTSLLIGGGGGVAIRFDSTLAQGRTQACSTFANPPLCSEGDFQCVVVEVFGFTG